MMKKLEAKLKSLDACIDGIASAMRCSTPQEAWEKAKPPYLIWIFFKIADDNTKDRFGLWSARQVQHLMTDPRSIAALDTKEKWLNGEATDEELKIALEAARAAAYAAHAAAVRDAAVAAYYAADAAAYASDGDAAAANAAAAAAVRVARDAAVRIARDAAVRIARDAAAANTAAADADTAARAAQTAWIRENFTPDFEKLLG